MTTRAPAACGAAAAQAPGPASGPSSFDFDRDLIASLPRLRLQALALTHNRADADDLVQDTVRNALAARDRFTPGTDLLAWLYRILRNRFLSKLRRAREVTGREEDLAAAALQAPGAQEDALVLGELRRALGRLPAEQRVALVAVVVEGMTYRAVAAATGCADGTAKSRVCRARNTLYAALLGPEAPRRRPRAGGPGGVRPEAVAALPRPPQEVVTFFGGDGAGHR